MSTYSNISLEDFYSNGFLLGPSFVDPQRCRHALREINRALGDLSDTTPWDKRAWTSSAITSLFNDSPLLRAACADLLGLPPRDLPYLPGAQVALRFPGALCLPGSFEPAPFWSSFWHIDGLPTPPSAAGPPQPPPTIGNFTLLVGVCLQDVASELAGNLVVFPRSHHLTERYFRSHGFSAALSGLPSLPPLPLPEPHQVRLAQGDVVLAHYSLCHSVAPNVTPDVRYMAYFRINMRSAAHHPEPMLDIWADYNPRFRTLQQEILPVSAEILASIDRLIDGQAIDDPTLFNSNSNASPSQTQFTPRYPGHVDVIHRNRLATSLASDAAQAEKLLRANAQFEAQRWGDCLEAMCELADARPHDAMLWLKAGVCCTAGPKERLGEGERRLSVLTEKLAPGFANPWVVLARNLQRQAAEAGRPELLGQAASCALVGLLLKAPAADMAVDAVKVLAETVESDEIQVIALDTNTSLSLSSLLSPSSSMLTSSSTIHYSTAIERAQQRYPELAGAIAEAAQRDATKPLWREGQQWLASPDPKDIARGLSIFGRIVALNARDYWAHVLNGGCLIAAGRPAESLPLFEAARAVDCGFPHAHVMAAQATKILGRQREAVELVQRMLRLGEALKCQEQDHYEKVVDGVQLLADCLLPQDQQQFQNDRALAIQLFPQLSQRLLQIVKNEASCIIS